MVPGTGALSMWRYRTGQVSGLGRSGGKESDYLAVHPEMSIGNCYPSLRGGKFRPKLKQTNMFHGLLKYALVANSEGIHGLSYQLWRYTLP